MKKVNLIKFFIVLFPYIVLFLYNIIIYPLSEEKIYDSKKNIQVISEYNDDGLIIYISKNENEYFASIYTESIILNKYKLEKEFAYKNTCSTVAFSKKNIYALDLDENNINLIKSLDNPNRIEILNIIILMVINVISLIIIKIFFNRKI